MHALVVVAVGAEPSFYGRDAGLNGQQGDEEEDSYHETDAEEEDDELEG